MSSDINLVRPMDPPSEVSSTLTPARRQKIEPGNVMEPGRPRYALPPSNFSPQVAVTLDRLFNANVANYTGGTDPRVIPLAFLDWWVKLSWSPGTHARLTEKAVRKMVRFSLYL